MASVSFLICIDTVGWVRNNSSAARVKLPSLTIVCYRMLFTPLSLCLFPSLIRTVRQMMITTSAIPANVVGRWRK